MDDSRKDQQCRLFCNNEKKYGIIFVRMKQLETPEASIPNTNTAQSSSK